MTINRTESIYLTEVTEIGPEVPDFLEAGLVILFEAGAPPELAEIAVLHDTISRREEPPAAGDVISFGDLELRITAIGAKAWSNVLELGHAVFKFNGADQVELPGEIYVQETDLDALAGLIRPGLRVEIKSGSSNDQTERNDA